MGCASSCDGGDSEDVLLDDVGSNGELGVDCSLLYDMHCKNKV